MTSAKFLLRKAYRTRQDVASLGVVSLGRKYVAEVYLCGNDAAAAHGVAA